MALFLTTYRTMMDSRTYRLILCCCLMALTAAAQTNIQTVKDRIRTDLHILASEQMQGRGYVNEGHERAAALVQRRFAEYKLNHAPGADSYMQGYTFGVNTFPGKMDVGINGAMLRAGADYLVDAASSSCAVKDLKIKKADLGEVNDTTAWSAMLATFDEVHAWYLEHADELCKKLGIRMSSLMAQLPKGCYIVPESTKLTWTVSTKSIPATVFYIKEDALPRPVRTLSAQVLARYVAKDRNENIIAAMPGLIKDSFILFSAHYDHLGRMGDNALFPGASDNASGTALMLYLASWFSTHPQRYSILFIAFSGEEAGLLGSEFYVKHPVVPLKNIKLMVNLDIMGDATDGVTVVNATEYPDQFALLNRINEEHHYLPAIKSRGKAANSDHYHFSEAGVPAFFIYSNGGKGYYHDIYDTAESVTLNHIDDAAQMLIDLTAALR